MKAMIKNQGLHLLTLTKSVLFFLICYSTVYPQGTTPFTDLQKNKAPNYYIIKRVVSNNELLLKKYYSQKEWESGNVKNAWTKSRSYFPKKFHFNSSTTYFMTHQFTGGGLAKIEVYQSEEIKKAAKNFNRFNDQSIVPYYKDIKKRGNTKEIAEFKQKLGLLASYFDSNKLRRLLKSYLGTKLYQQMLKSLRDEGDHIFAAALLHEGMHATIGGAKKANKIDKDFKSCKAPVNWDELKGYMSEMQYHYNYFEHSQDKINAHMKAINKLLAELERFRNKKKPLKKSDVKKIEKIKAKIKAHITMIRVSLREMQQSLNRIKSLLDFFKKQKYVKDTAPKEYHDMVKSLEEEASKFSKEIKKSIDAYEKALKNLEKMLNAWNEWAACKEPDPPTEEDHKKTKKEFEDVTWPSSPDTKKEKDLADQKLAITYNIGPYSVDSSKEEVDKEMLIEDLSKVKDSIPIKDHDNSVSVSVGIETSKPSMDALNNYIDYLNNTWNGTIGSVNSIENYWINISYPTSEHFDIGLEYLYGSTSVSGFLQNQSADYSNKTTLHSIGLTGMYSTEIASGIDFMLGGGLSYNSTKYTETEASFVASGNSSALGFQTSAGISFKLSSNIELLTAYGYRFATMDSFDSDLTFFNANNDPVEIDYSGSFFRFGVQVSF